MAAGGAARGRGGCFADAHQPPGLAPGGALRPAGGASDGEEPEGADGLDDDGKEPGERGADMGGVQAGKLGDGLGLGVGFAPGARFLALRTFREGAAQRARSGKEPAGGGAAAALRRRRGMADKPGGLAEEGAGFLQRVAETRTAPAEKDEIEEIAVLPLATLVLCVIAHKTDAASRAAICTIRRGRFRPWPGATPGRSCGPTRAWAPRISMSRDRTMRSPSPPCCSSRTTALQQGEGGQYVSDGTIRLGGRRPNNTSGGHLCEGYTHGMNMVIENVRQVRRHDADDSCPVGPDGDQGIPTTTVKTVADRLNAAS